jgi:hypothetical protein
MNGLDHRMRKIEEKANSAKGGRILFCWTEPGEDLAEAGEKWRAENPGQEDAELVFVGWADESTMPPQHSQPEPQHRASEIDREIERLYSEL